MRTVAVTGLVLGGLVAALPAGAAVLDWQISEVVSSVGGNRELRFVELYTAPGTVDRVWRRRDPRQGDRVRRRLAVPTRIGCC